MKGLSKNYFRNVKFYGPEDDENDNDLYSTDESTSLIVDDDE